MLREIDLPSGYRVDSSAYIYRLICMHQIKTNADGGEPPGLRIGELASQYGSQKDISINSQHFFIRFTI